MPQDRDLITGRLNVNEYVNARKADIKNLENLSRNSGAASKKRAFQSLPRTERRRAASHDPNRVPRRKGLRKRAEFEAIRDNSKLDKSRKRKKSRLPPHVPIDVSQVNDKSPPPQCDSPGSRYGHRQRDKIWLPTHIWHKKRAHMVPMAGTLIPKTASQKQYRRTHRLTAHIDERGAMAWDSSYYSTIVVRNVVENTAASIEQMFPKSSLSIYQQGKKLWQGLSSIGGPCSVYWFTRQDLTIQCNPLSFDSVWDVLKKCPDLVLEDCRYAIGNIDLIGPQKFQLITRISEPFGGSRNFKDTWQSMRNSGISQSQIVSECIVNDPRSRKSSHNFVGKCNISGGLYSKEIRQKSLDQFRSQTIVNSTQGEKNSGQPVEIPVTIMFLEDGRVRLSMPRSWVLPFWSSIFRRRNVLIGGQSELNQLALESNSPCFPYDFPHLSSAASYLSNEETCLINSKDSQSSLAQVSQDFFSDQCQAEFCHVSVDAQQRGIPATGSQIISATAEKEIKVPAGIVTTGSFGFNKARGVGIGLCVRRNIMSDKAEINPSGVRVFITKIDDCAKVL